MSLIQAQIKRLEKLTAINGEWILDISAVLDSFEALKNGTLSLPSVTSRSGRTILIPREDLVIPSSITRAELLRCSHQKIAWNQIALTSIMVGE